MLAIKSFYEGVLTHLPAKEKLPLKEEELRF
jgi:hypothetical protein